MGATSTYAHVLVVFLHTQTAESHTRARLSIDRLGPLTCGCQSSAAGAAGAAGAIADPYRVVTWLPRPGNAVRAAFAALALAFGGRQWPDWAVWTGIRGILAA